MDCRDEPGNARQEMIGRAGPSRGLLTDRRGSINPLAALRSYCATTPSGAASISKAAAISALV